MLNSTLVAIEEVQINETDDLCQLSRRSFYDAFHLQTSAIDMQLFLEENFTIAALKHELQTPGNLFYFAKVNNQVVGYMKLSLRDQPVTLPQNSLEIARLYVDPALKNNGIGKSMMQFVLAKAIREGRAVVWLGVWEHNYPAIAFYERFGFKKFDSHIFMVGNDAQTDNLMKKDLL